MIKHTTGTKFLNAYLRIGMKGLRHKGTTNKMQKVVKAYKREGAAI